MNCWPNLKRNWRILGSLLLTIELNELFSRIQLENKHQEALDVELQRVTERFQREVQACKKKQWCHQCENEGKL